MAKKRKKINTPDRVQANPQVTTVFEYFGPYNGRRSRPLKGQLIGIEVEIETSNDVYPDAGRMNSTEGFWNSIRDDSLRRADEAATGGQEYVCKKPIKTSQAEEALLQLETLLNEAGSKIRWSNRCSVHVHLNVQDMTLSELICLLTLYYTVEPILSRYNGFDRENNIFCMQAVNSYTIIDTFMSFLRTKRFNENTKYSALNLMNLQQGNLGTIEFRAGAGIDKTPLEALPWIKLIDSLVQSAKNFERPSDILSAVSSEGVLEFIETALPQIYAEGIASFDKRELEGALMSSMRVAQTVAYEIDWGHYEPPVKEPKKKTKTPRNVRGEMELQAERIREYVAEATRTARTRRPEPMPLVEPRPVYVNADGDINWGDPAVRTDVPAPAQLNEEGVRQAIVHEEHLRYYTTVDNIEVPRPQPALGRYAIDIPQDDVEEEAVDDLPEEW